MGNGTILELATLPERHPPVGEALLQIFAPATIVRLSVDPNPQPVGTMSRAVEVSWIRRPGKDPEAQQHRDMGWNGLEQTLGAVCVQLPFTVNDRTLTEQAAIGILALLISDLERGVLERVLQIGNGGDYVVRLKGAHSLLQVEVSGIKSDAREALSSPRLREKTEQVLTQRRVGYVSVTAFSYRAEGIVHSYLHYVKRKKRPGRKSRKKK